MVEIKFDYRFASQEFFTAEVKLALEVAGKIWSNLLQDDFENIPVGTNLTIQNPVTGVDETIALTEAIDDILIFVGATDNPFGGIGDNTTSLGATDYHLTGCCCNYCHSHLENNTDLSQPGILNSSAGFGLLAQAKVDGTDLKGDLFQRRISSNFRNTGAVTDFEPWVGVIAFATDLPQNGAWDFGLGNPDPEKFDFISVALHEIGHILGIGVAPTFRNLAQNGSFTGFNARNLNNNQNIPLESDLGHVKEGFANNATLLDPILGAKRLTPSSIDLALLADIGYEIANFTKQGSIPEIATEGSETIVGATFADFIDGLGGDDQIQGQEGDDTIRGGTGNDTVFGAVGRDFILGDEGNDNLFGDEQEDTLEGGAGNDVLVGQLGSDFLVGNSGNDTLQGGAGSDTLQGNDNNDLVLGEAGQDILFGDRGADELQGGEGNDNLRGGNGNDLLFGQENNDTLEGGRGDDTLQGGTGRDRFDFGFNFDNDTINDYVVAEDSIRVSAKYDFLTQRYDLTEANQVLNAITDSGTVTNSEQIFTEITLRQDKIITIFHDRPLTTAEVELYFPFQSSLQVTSSGLKLQFSQSLDTSLLNLYQGNKLALNLPDLVLTKSSQTPSFQEGVPMTQNNPEKKVAGSLVWHEGDRTLTFTKTDGILEAGSYTLNLFSRQDGLVSNAGELLDGDNDGIAGDNFVTEFEINSNQQRVLRIDNLSRGIGQELTNPKTNQGLTISLDNGAGVSQVSFTLTYDATILNLDDLVLNADIADDWTITTKNLETPGKAIVNLQGSTALDSGEIDLLQLQGTINPTAAANSSHLVSLDAIDLNQGNIQAFGNEALLQVTKLGDTDGDSIYSQFDALSISEIASGIRDGLDNFQNTDPLIIADVNSDGVVSAFDAYLIAQQADGISSNFIL